MKLPFPSLKKMAAGAALFTSILSGLGSPGQQRIARPWIIPKPLLPEKLMDMLIDEVSGERQLNTVRLLASFERNRTAEEYEKVFYESQVILQRLREFGLRDSGIEEVPVVLLGSQVWDAESAELWLIEPEKKRLVSLDDVPACLCEQSQPSDVTAELVFVGLGTTEKDYEGKDVKDKIVLVTARPLDVNALAVKHGAKGLISSYSSNSDFDPDQVGRDTLARNYDTSPADAPRLAFGFMVSARMGEELRRGTESAKVIVRAKCQTKTYPYRNEIVWALIEGSERSQEELIFTAHLFEEMAYQGANDNASGSASILETARVIQTLVANGSIDRPKRSIRFLWIDEGAGTLGYLQKHPDVLKRCYANINEDMVGEALIKNRSSFHLTTTPDSKPSYLNDVLANFIEYVGETNRDNIINRPAKFVKPILSPSGTKDPFYYHIDKYSGGSDHTIFLDGGIGIPAVQLGAWPDMWYHSSEDRPDKCDSTQLKRVGVITAAAALFLSGASRKEALQLIGEVSGRGSGRIGDDEKRAYGLLDPDEPEGLAENYKEARNIIVQAFARERAAVQSVGFFVPNDREFLDWAGELFRVLSARENLSLDALRNQYLRTAGFLGLKPVFPGQTPEEWRLSEIIPVRTGAMRGYFDRGVFANRTVGKNLPSYRLRSQEDFEIRNFIDGARSILEIRNAVSAEFRPLPLADVENYIRALETAGMVILERKKT
jgi:hypothetical protein